MTTKKRKKKAKTVISNRVQDVRDSEAAIFSRRMQRRFSFLVCIIVVVIAALPLSAAGKKPADYALIFGTVWDAEDHAAAGVTVKIRRADQKKAKWTLISDSRGEFAQRVPVGKADYIVWAEVPKKKGAAAEATVHIEHNERANTGLHLAK
jgi:hypothetical protein